MKKETIIWQFVCSVITVHNDDYRYVLEWQFFFCSLLSYAFANHWNGDFFSAIQYDNDNEFVFDISIFFFCLSFKVFFSFGLNFLETFSFYFFFRSVSVEFFFPMFIINTNFARKVCVKKNVEEMFLIFFLTFSLLVMILFHSGFFFIFHIKFIHPIIIITTMKQKKFHNGNYYIYL